MTPSTHGTLHVVVVGAGIIGASIAYHLAQRDTQVTVLDRGQPGQGASGHSFAWLNSFGKEPWHYHDLNRRSMDMWHRFAHDLPADIDLQWGGELRWEYAPDRVKALEERIAQLHAWGYPTRVLDGETLRRLEPEVRPGEVVLASWGTIDGRVVPTKVAEACLHQAQTRGATVHLDTPVTGLRLSQPGGAMPQVQGVYTADGEIACDVLVLASGTETTALAAMAGLSLPQQESPGVVIRTNPQPRVLHNVAILHMPPIDNARLEIHLRQDADGSFMIGEGSQESLSRDDSQAHADDLLARATHYLPILAGATAHPEPVGYRPLPLDGLPVLGFPTAVPNCYIALMHSGVTLAPLVGAYAAMEIADGAHVELLAPYRPERLTS